MNNKSTNKLIVFASGILAIFAFSLIIATPAKALADLGGGSAIGTCTSDCSYAYVGPSNNYNYNNPTYPVGPAITGLPVITSLSPSTAIVGTNGATVTITGFNFTPGASARWNGFDRATTYISSTQLIMTLTANDLAVKGAYIIIVHSYAPITGDSTNSALFHVNAPASSFVATTTPVKSTPKVAAAVTTTAASGLSANALSAGFMPSGFLGWLFFLLLILIIVMLARKAFAPTDHKPLKHA